MRQPPSPAVRTKRRVSCFTILERLSQSMALNSEQRDLRFLVFAPLPPVAGNEDKQGGDGRNLREKVSVEARNAGAQ